MCFETSVQRLLVGILVGFGMVMAAAVYWAVIGPESALQEPINYRLRDEAASLIRGVIFDRSGLPMVTSEIDDDGFVTRRASDAALDSLTGYSSQQYGVGGAEAAYDSVLRGVGLIDPMTDSIQHDLLHLPRRGSDIRLTIDFTTQQAAAEALSAVGQPGGAVVMDAGTGELLAIASFPTVDPATLDANWATLVADPNTPFLNRATQGQYKPGSALDAAILAAWLIDGHALTEELPADITTVCPALDGAAMEEAFTSNCAAGIAYVIEQLGQAKIDAMIDLFGLRTSVALEGFTLPPAPTPRHVITPEATVSPEATAEPTPPAFAPDPFGLDTIRRSPLELAVMTAVIANGGNAPQPTLLDATRAPNTIDWILAARTGQTVAVTTDQTADAVADAMRESSASGLAHSEVCTGTDIGAMVGMSRTDDGSQVFFTGFAQLANAHTVVAVLAFEGIDLSRASDVAAAGNAVLCAALAGYAEG